MSYTLLSRLRHTEVVWNRVKIETLVKKKTYDHIKKQDLVVNLDTSMRNVYH